MRHGICGADLLCRHRGAASRKAHTPQCKAFARAAGCVLGGAAFCLLCDLIARSIFAPTELSVSSVTAIFGAPVVILLLVRKQRREAAA